MISSTNLNDLPITTTTTTTTSLPSQQNGENVFIDKNPIQAHQQQQQQPQYQPPFQPEQKAVSLDPNTINQIVHELHQATLTGVTKLQPRDIPSPPSQQQDSINNHTSIPSPSPSLSPSSTSPLSMPSSTSSSSYSSIILNLDYWYNEFQIPIIVGLLFFLFQILTGNRMLRQYLSFLYLENGTTLSMLLFSTTIITYITYKSSVITSKSVLIIFRIKITPIILFW